LHGRHAAAAGSCTELTQEKAQLHYAPRPALLRRRRVRHIALLAVLVILAATGWFQRQRLIFYGDRAMLLRAQRRALTFNPPPTKVVYEEDPAAARALLQDRDYHAAIRPHRPQDPIAMFEPGLLDPRLFPWGCERAAGRRHAPVPA
jgi:hypothetical protein